LRLSYWNPTAGVWSGDLESSYIVDWREVELERERRRGFGQAALLVFGVELILVRGAGVLGDEGFHGGDKRSKTRTRESVER
jgi:hypothetical protein